MKYILLLMVCSFFTAACGSKEEVNPIKRTETVTIKLPTMVCSQCADIIEKAIYTIDGVKEANVDEDKKIVSVTYVPFQTNQETIEIVITRAGYDANNRKRDPDAYEKLDACCKNDG